MKKKSLACVLMMALAAGCFSLSVPAAAKESTAAQVKEQQIPEKVHSRMVKFLTKHMTRCNINVRPNREHPDVTKQENGKYVAYYIALDPDSVTVDVQPTKSKYFQYVARVKYRENHFQCVADSKKKALEGPFRLVKVRRLTEIARYSQGAWSM